MKRRFMAIALAVVMAAALLPATALAEDSSQVLRVQNTDTWYSDATRAFMTKDSYWGAIVTSAPEDYQVDNQEKTVSISTPEALVWWAEQVNHGTDFSGYTVNISADLDMSAHYWTPICTGTVSYSEDGKYSIASNSVLDDVVIEGNNHAITGLATQTGVRGPNQDSKPGDGNNCYYYAAFIGYSSCDITVQNLTFDGARIAITEPFDEVVNTYGSSMVSVVVGAQSGGSLTLNNVVVNDADVLAMQKASAFVGSLMGESTLTVNNCAITNSRFSAFFMVAPIAGYCTADKLTINGIKLENNTIRAVEQSNYTYTQNEATGSQYWDGDLNASTTAVFSDVDTSNMEGEMVMVAQVDGYTYPTIAAAISAAEDGGTVELLRNAESSSRVSVNKNLTLDLNGNTLVSTADIAFLIMPDKSFELTGGVLDHNPASGTTKCGAFVAPKAEFTLSADATIESTGAGVLGTNNSASEGGATFNIFGTIDCDDIGVWSQGPNNTVNIDGATINSRYFGVYQNGSFGGCTITIRNSTINDELPDGAGVYISNNSTNAADPNQGMQTLTVENSTVRGATAIETKYTNVTITNSTITTTADNVTYYQNNNGSTSTGFAVVSTDNSVEPNSPQPDASVTINGGYYTGLIGLGSLISTEDYPDFKEASYSITGGHFTDDPSLYVAEGYAALTSDVEGYAFTVGEAVETEVDVTPATGQPVVDMSNIAGADKDAVEAAADSVLDNGALAAAANSVLGSVTKEQKEAAEAAIQDDEDVTVGEDTVTVYVQTYLDITPTAYDEEGKTMTLEIVPMYRVVASTAKNTQDIRVVGETEEEPNAVVLSDSKQELTEVKTMTISITLPSGFAEDGQLYVRHAKDNGSVYFYTGAVASDVLTFTNPNGFSEFTVTATNDAEAEINGVGYATLQQAVNEVPEGGIIKLLQNDRTATVSRPVTFTVDENGTTGLELKAGANYTMQEDNGTYTFTYTPPYIPPVTPDEPEFPFTDVAESAWYYDEVYYVWENDLMNGIDSDIFDPEGDTSRGMLVTILYRLEGEPDISNEILGYPFEDVEDTWYTNAVYWARLNGIVNGVSDTEFAPDDDVTREQMAAILYRYAEYKGYSVAATGDMTTFEDYEDAFAYSEDALNWAIGNGIINGMEGNTLQPKGGAIRAQIAAVIMRYCENIVK